MMYLLFDTETTGLPNDYKAPASDIENWPRLVQLSFVITDGTNREEFDFIVKPDGFEISKEASDIHGITQERAIKEGKDIKFVLDIFKMFIGLSDQIIAHNMDFDKRIVGAEYYRLNGHDKFTKYVDDKKKLFCTMQASTDLVGIKHGHGGGNKWPKLVELYQYFFKEDFEDQHNSLADVRATERCFFELLKRPENKGCLEKKRYVLKENRPNIGKEIGDIYNNEYAESIEELLERGIIEEEI